MLVQFVDHDFASLSGARVVRIATHPDFQKVTLELSCTMFLEMYVRTRLVQPTCDPEPPHTQDSHTHTRTCAYTACMQCAVANVVFRIVKDCNQVVIEILGILVNMFGVFLTLCGWPKMGYGLRALQLLQDYFEGHISNLSEAEMEVESVNRVDTIVSP